MNLDEYINNPTELHTKDIDGLWDQYLDLSPEQRAEILEDIRTPEHYLEGWDLLAKDGLDQLVIDAEPTDQDAEALIPKALFGQNLFRHLLVHQTEQAARDSEHETFRRLARRSGSSSAIQIFLHHRDQFTDEAVAEILPDLWTAPNTASMPRGFTREIAIELYERTGFLTDGPERPTEPARVYHGVVIDAGDNEFKDDMWDGMCWTRDLDVARKFAVGGAVYTTIAQPENVLARYDRRGEHEWVIDPLQHDIELHEIIPGKHDRIAAFRALGH